MGPNFDFDIYDNEYILSRTVARSKIDNLIDSQKIYYKKLKGIQFFFPFKDL